LSEQTAKRLPRKTKKLVKKERPAGSPSHSHKAGGATPSRKRTFKRKTNRSLLIAKVPSQRLLASIARKFRTHDKQGYDHLKTPGSDPRTLAAEIAAGSFAPVLAKYHGFDAAQLMQSVITDCIRAPRKAPVAPALEQRAPKGLGKQLTARQLEAQAKQPQGPPPAASNVSATTRPKGAPKKVLPREKYTDAQIALDSLNELFRSDNELRALFCGAASIAEAKRMLRTNEVTQDLAERLELASPTRVYNRLSSAIRVLLPQYIEEQKQAQWEAQKAAEERRASMKLVPHPEGKKPKAAQPKAVNPDYGNVATPAYWRGLQQQRA
jgi:hypothetical protein